MMKSQKRTSKKNANRNLKIRDLKTKKDAKGGEEVTFNYGKIHYTYNP